MQDAESRLNKSLYLCSNFRMELSDEVLIVQLRQGNEKAYRQLYLQHYEMLCRVAYAFLGDTHLSEAIVNHLIADIWEKRTSLMPGGTLRSYLVRAVRNRCINYLKLERVQKEVRLPEYDTALNDVVTDEYPSGELIGRELEALIKQSIGKMAPECRRVFELSRFGEVGNAEIAERLNISVNTVKYHIKSALSRLREDLADYISVFIFLFFSL